MKYEIV